MKHTYPHTRKKKRNMNWKKLTSCMTFFTRFNQKTTICLEKYGPANTFLEGLQEIRHAYHHFFFTFIISELQGSMKQPSEIRFLYLWKKGVERWDYCIPFEERYFKTEWFNFCYINILWSFMILLWIFTECVSYT